MKSLSKVVNDQTDSYIKKLSADRNIVKIRRFYLDNDCIWRNSDLHILCFERINHAPKDGINYFTRRKFYIILRMDRLLDKKITTHRKLAGFLNKISPPNTASAYIPSDDFDLKGVLKAARSRADYRKYYAGIYSSSMQHQRPVEEVSVEHHSKIYENKNMTVTEVAYYLEIPLSRAKALFCCPRFPIQARSWPRRVSVAALNSWLLENPELLDIPTNDLVDYMRDKVFDIWEKRYRSR